MKSSGNAGVALSPENVIGIMQAQFPGGIDVQRIFLPAGKDGAYMVTPLGLMITGVVIWLRARLQSFLHR